jgi:putative membrane protein
MRLQILLASAAMLALAGCGGDRGGTADNGAADTMAIDNGGAPADNMAAPAPAPVPQTGQDYVDKASASDMFEIESGRLAEDKAQSDDVKTFARMIVKDHRKSTADLKAAAAKASPPIAVAPALDAEQSADLAALRSAAAADFDRTFLAQQIAAHEKALAMVRAYAGNGDVPSLKEHAAAVAGPIEMHLNRARELSQRAGR